MQAIAKLPRTPAARKRARLIATNEKTGALVLSDRPQKITFGEMREMGVRGLLIYCADYRCSHSIAISGDAWPDDARLSDIEERFTCRVCGKRGADVRPDFNGARRRQR
jgi:hypothetical protein